MLGPGDFVAAPVRGPAGHCATYEETERRLRPALDLIPITRVYDATSLDWIGLPVWAAVTPLALDLTVHAGKGSSHAAARISATMEAVERVCAEEVEGARIRQAPWEELRQAEEAIDPERFDLPFETTYSAREPVSWVRGYDLISQREIWVPLDLAISPARQGVCLGVETNGLASGNTITEATLHALYELIERDTFALEQFRRRYGEGDQRPTLRIVARTSLPPETTRWVDQLRDAGMITVIRELRNEFGVPVFHAAIHDNSFPGNEGHATSCDGMGCDLDPARALFRSVSEAVQSHTVLVVGARDTVESASTHAGPGKAAFLRQITTPTELIEFTPGGPELAADLRVRLQSLIDRLAGAGFEHCVVVDLTRTELGIPVVRVLVPGLSGPFGNTSRRPAERLLRTLI